MALLVWHTFIDGYCSTVQGLLDWFEVDLGFTELLFIQIGLCVAVCFCSLYKCHISASVLQCVAVCCSVLQCVAVCCSATSVPHNGTLSMALIQRPIRMSGSYEWDVTHSYECETTHSYNCGMTDS